MWSAPSSQSWQIWLDAIRFAQHHWGPWGHGSGKLWPAHPPSAGAGFLWATSLSPSSFSAQTSFPTCSFLTFLITFLHPFLVCFHTFGHSFSHTFSQHSFQTPSEMFQTREHPALPMTDFQTLSNSHLTCSFLESPVLLKLTFPVTRTYLSQTHFLIPRFSVLVVAILFYKCRECPP